MALAEDLGVFPSTQEGPKLTELLELILNSRPSPVPPSLELGSQDYHLCWGLKVLSVLSQFSTI